MNKQKLIERIEGLKNLFGNKAEYVKIDTVIELISELDEPQKVKVPQYIAEEIEHFKKTGDWDLFKAMNYLFKFEKTKSCEWLESKDNQETFARAWLDGYEAEEEKRYYIRLKGVDENYNYLNFIRHFDAWCLAEIKTDKKFRTTHTRKELEDAGFGEVFNSPLFEVEELENE